MIGFKHSPKLFKDALFHITFGNVGCCDFSINNPQNTDWLRDFNMKYSILSQIDYKNSSVDLIKFLKVKI